MRWYSFPLLLCFTALSCGIDPDADGSQPACNGPDCQGADAGATDALADDDFPDPPVSVDDQPVDSGTEEAQHDAGATERFPVCSGLCSPDDRTSCFDFDPDDPLEERSLYQNGSSSLLMLRQLMEQGIDAGAADASAASPDGSVGTGSASSPTDGAWSCQIDRDEGEVAVGCYLSGTGEDQDPCTSSRDCSGGYACVDEQGVGHCRKFCCGGDAACIALDAGQDERQHYCEERPLRSTNTAETEPLMVPVCALADMCDLSEPFPCDDAASCACKDGKACTVVNAAGATGCSVPGEGGLDEACPCLPGFLCDPIENTCKQLCNLQLAGCGDAICQATANFPAGWGVCQSVAPETD